MLGKKSLLFHCSKESHPIERNWSDNFDMQFKTLFSHNEPQLWLETMVALLRQFSVDSLSTMELFNGWHQEYLYQGIDFINQPPILNLINTLFFYKSQPEKLAIKAIPFEKLVSYSQRLENICAFIVMLLTQLSSKAQLEGVSQEINCFLQEEYLPINVKFLPNDALRVAILAVMSQAPVLLSIPNETAEINHKLSSLLSFYRYNFSPITLIDTFLVLEQKLLRNTPLNLCRKKLFKNEVHKYLQFFSTKNTLQLYGYLTNRNTCELLFALDKAGNDFGCSKKSPLLHVISLFQLTIAALDDILQQRGFLIEPLPKIVALVSSYDEVIVHLLNTYTFNERLPNTELEDLFNHLEYDVDADS